MAPLGLSRLAEALVRGEGTIDYLRDAPPSYNAPYYAVAHLWLALTPFGADEVGLRLLSLVAGVAAVANALGKVALDAIIQREVPESLRASAFARSETVLQLSWVVGGAFGIALPPTGWLGFTVAAALLVLAVGLVLWSLYRGSRTPPRPAEVSPDAPTEPVGQSWS